MKGKRVICRSLLYEAREVQEIEDDNMSITRSISVAQTDNRVLKAGSYVDYFFY